MSATYWNATNFPFTFSVDDGNARFLGNVQLSTGSGNVLLEQNGNARFSGSVRIGPQAAAGSFSGYRLSVDGPINSKRLVVQTTSWADDVFQPGYTLRPLSEVEGFVRKEGHLPDVPSEEEVKKDGVDVGDMNAILLRKVEELTLYILKQQAEIDALKKKTSHL